MQTQGILWCSQEVSSPLAQSPGCTRLCFLFLHLRSVMFLKQIYGVEQKLH